MLKYLLTLLIIIYILSCPRLQKNSTPIIVKLVDNFISVKIKVNLFKGHIIFVRNRKQWNKIMHSLNGNMMSERIRASWKAWYPGGLISLEIKREEVTELTKFIKPIKTSGKSYLCGLFAIFSFLNKETFTDFSHLIEFSHNALSENAIATLYYICGGKRNLFLLEATDQTSKILLVKRIAYVGRRFKKKPTDQANIFIVNRGFHWEPCQILDEPDEGAYELKFSEDLLYYSFDPSDEDLIKPSDVDLGPLMEEIKTHPNYSGLMNFVKMLLESNLSEQDFHNELESFVAEDSIKSHMSLLWYQNRNIQEFKTEKINLYKECKESEDLGEVPKILSSFFVETMADQTEETALLNNNNIEGVDQTFEKQETTSKLKLEIEESTIEGEHNEIKLQPLDMPPLENIEHPAHYDYLENKAFWQKRVNSRYQDCNNKSFKDSYLDKMGDFDFVIESENYLNGLVGLYNLMKGFILPVSLVDLMKLCPVFHLTPEVIIFLFESFNGYCNFIFQKGFLIDKTKFEVIQIDYYIVDKNAPFIFLVNNDSYWYRVKPGTICTEIHEKATISEVIIDPDILLEMNVFFFSEITDTLKYLNLPVNLLKSLDVLSNNMEKLPLENLKTQCLMMGLPVDYLPLILKYKLIVYNVRNWLDIRTNMTNHLTPIPEVVTIFQYAKEVRDDNITTHVGAIEKSLFETIEMNYSEVSELSLGEPKDPSDLSYIEDSEETSPYTNIKKDLRELAEIPQALLYYCEQTIDHKIGLLNRKSNLFWQSLLILLEESQDKSVHIDFFLKNKTRQNSLLKLALENPNKISEFINPLLVQLPIRLLKSMGKQVKEIFSFYKTSFGVMGQWQFYNDPLDYIAHVNQSNLLVIYEKHTEFYQYFELNANLVFIVCIDEILYLPNIPIYVTYKDLSSLFEILKITHVNHVAKTDKAIIFDKINCFKIVRSLITSFDYSLITTDLLKVVQIGIYKLRHDLIVYMIFRTYGFLNWSEKTLSEDFPGISPESARLTPDFYLNQNVKGEKTCYIYEVSITLKPNIAKQEKIQKYQKLVEEVDNLCTGGCKFIPIVLLPNLANMQRTFSEYMPTVSNENLNFIWTMMNMIANLMYTMNSRIGSPFGDMPKIELINFNPRKQVLEEEKNLYNSIQNSLGLRAMYKEVEEIKNPFYGSKKPRSEDIVNVLRDLRKQTQNFTQQSQAKPTFHFLIDPRLAILPDKVKDYSYFIKDKLSEEKIVLDFFLNIFNIVDDAPNSFEFLKELQKKFIKLSRHDLSMQIYLTGELEDFTRQQFNDKNIHLKQANQKQLNNYLKAAQTELRLPPLEFLSKYHKSIKMNKPFYNLKAFEFYKKAGIRSKYHNNFIREVKTQTSTLLLDERHFERVEIFLGEMTNTLSNQSLKYLPDFLISSNNILDHQFVQKTKDLMHEEMNPLLALLSKTLIYEFSYRYHLFASQMLHVGSFKGRESHYYFFTTGIKNIICCVAGRKEKRNTDPGVSFFFFGYLQKTKKVVNVNTNIEEDINLETKDLQPSIQLFSELFGDIDYYNSSGKIFFCSCWRRIKKTKLAFINDVFYSTLTSAMCDLSLHTHKIGEVSLNEVREYYTIRVVFGVNASQKIAEMSMDMKFAVLASLSDYSHLVELLKDKFTPSYPSHICVWFIFNLFRICRNILLSKEKNLSMVKLNVPEFVEDVRQLRSAGGKILLPGLWSMCRLTDFNLFLNSIHSYVHTIKEPVSLHYESIKAMKTIVKFDNIYQYKEPNLKYGLTTSETLNTILNDTSCGFSSSFLYYNTINFFEQMPVDFNLILADNVFKMPLVHLSSTKASILTHYRTEESYKRYKVHDCLVLRPEMHNLNLITHAQNYFKSGDFTQKKIIADICIKEQYGAKREFYVLDIESKFLCKFVEEIFKKIAKLTKTECISVPGDLKLMKIQSLVNSITKHASSASQQAFFINGDCTKWSASEMLESFLSMLMGMKKILGDPLYYLMFSIIYQWKSSKYIQIPETLITKCDIPTEFNSYSFKGEERIFRMKLEQNFLMGLFNYMSSIKGSIVYESVKQYIEMEMDNVKMEHLEHSDDYLIGVSCRQDQILRIREIQMKFMRLGGITDSIKKTTISKWYAEFVSLYCFNGHMTYPSIKKTKEVSSALTGNGFQEDSAAVGSRTAEVVRVGLTFTNALFFLKMHNWLLADLYGLLPNQRNEDKFSLLKLFEKPVENFGLSECHPLLYLINSGDMNNLRLFRYQPKALKMLGDLSLNNFEQFAAEDFYEGVIGFKKPTYVFKNPGVRLNKLIKEAHIDLGAGSLFWEQHPALKYHKPFIPNLFDDYLRAHYSIKQFKRAYEQQSRLSTILKISRYKSKPILSAPYFSEELMTILDYQAKVFTLPYKNFDKQEIRNEFLSNGDTAGILFYELLDASEYRFGKENIRAKFLAANLTPFYYDPVKVDTPLGFLLLKKYEPLVFDLEESYISLKWPIEEDMKVIDRLDCQFSHLPTSRRINLIYNYIMCAKKPTRAIMTPFTERKELLGFILDMFKFQTSLRAYIDIKVNKEIRFINPINPDLPCYMFQGQEITLERAIALNLIGIYTVLKFKDKKTIAFIRDYFEKLILKTGQNSLAFLNNIKYTDLTFLGFKYSEIHSIMFIKAEICYDHDQIIDFLQVWNSYSYRYKRKAALIKNKYVGDTICEFTHFDTDNMIMFYQASQETIILTNTKSLSKVYVILMIGAKLIQREFTKDWFIADVDKALSKYFLTYQDMIKCRKKLENHLPASYLSCKISCLLQNHGALEWVTTSYDDNTNEANYLPIFSINEYEFKERPEYRKMEFSGSMEIDTKNACLLLRPGNWVASRFGTSHIYTNIELFVNADALTLSGLKLEFALSNQMLKKLLMHVDGNLNIDLFSKNVIQDEIPSTNVQRFNMHDVVQHIPKYQEFKEATLISLQSLPQKEKNLQSPSQSDISFEKNILISSEEMFIRETKVNTVKIESLGKTSYLNILLSGIQYEAKSPMSEYATPNKEAIGEEEKIQGQIEKQIKLKKEPQINEKMEIDECISIILNIEKNDDKEKGKETIAEAEETTEKQVKDNIESVEEFRDIMDYEIGKYKSELKSDITGTYFGKEVMLAMFPNIDFSRYQEIPVSESDEEIENFYKDFQIIGLEDEEGIRIEKIHFNADLESVYLPSFLKNIKTEQSLWQDGLEIILNNMLIRNLGVSKFLILFISLMFGKHDNYTEIFHNDLHKHLLNRIKELIEKHPIWPHTEFMTYMPYSTRLEGDKIILYQYRFYNLPKKLTDEEAKEFIINDGKPCDYVEERTRFERKIPEKNLHTHYLKITELFLAQEVFRWGIEEFMPYNPFLYACINSKVTASLQEFFGEW